MQKKKEEEAAREKELNELFKVAISQPKVPLGMLTLALQRHFDACVIIQLGEFPGIRSQIASESRW